MTTWYGEAPDAELLGEKSGDHMRVGVLGVFPDEEDEPGRRPP